MQFIQVSFTVQEYDLLELCIFMLTNYCCFRALDIKSTDFCNFKEFLNSLLH